MHRWERALEEQPRESEPLELYPANLLPTIPEGFEFEEFQGPTNPEEQTPGKLEDEEDVKAHVLVNQW